MQWLDANANRVWYRIQVRSIGKVGILIGVPQPNNVSRRSSQLADHTDCIRNSVVTSYWAEHEASAVLEVPVLANNLMDSECGERTFLKCV